MATADPILQALNAAQREAVLHEGGPLLILAGAGSGKTRAVTHRIAHLLRRGNPPESLLAITFTNKAAEEMKERTERLCGVRSPWISTFHSFCARLLRRHAQRLVPYDNSFTIYDADDSRSLIKEVTDELDIDRSLWSPRAAQAEVSRIKNTTCGDVESAFGGDYLHGQALRSIYNLYVERMRERNAVDFDDLLLLAVRLLQEHADLLDRYRTQFGHVLVDEYQDTNALQYRIGRLLTETHGNICITGDPDQSIYGWRGADISNILNFEADYPNARVVLLDQNYRSTMNVLSVANRLIAHNVHRKPKSLWTEKPAGEPVRIYRFGDDGEEAREVAALVHGLAEEGTPPGDMAVFYRINSLSRSIEQELIYANIPYSIVGGIAYFLRKEVKDVLAYLRLVDNPRDTESLKRIINVPPRGIGKATCERMEARARAAGRSLLEQVLAEPTGGIGKKAEAGLRSFAEIHATLKSLRKGPVAALMTETIRLTGYDDYIRASQGEEGREVLDNVWELVNAAHAYDVAEPEGSLTAFLERVNLLGDVDRWQRREDRVSLMTLHSAKGLEFPVVVIAGVEDGILPLLSADDPDPDLEEERRLLYVGITRARERLYLTHAASRMRHGRVRAAFPSRFVKELMPRPRADEGEADSLEMDGDTQDSLEMAAAREGPFRRSGESPEVQLQETDVSEWPDWEDSFEPDEEPYPVGSRVYHDGYGEGEVVRLSGVGRRLRVTVAFDGAGEKQFVLGFAPLKRIR